MTESSRRGRLRWVVPAASIAVVAVAVAVPRVASADPALPARSPAQLLADVAAADGAPLSGTVVETARLGLPALPQAGDTSISPTTLLSGSHRARVWLAGPDRARVALVGDLAETDLVRTGRDVWLWTSGTKTVQHLRLPAGRPAEDSGGTTPASPEALTPQAAADRALAAITPSTRVSVDGTARVAGRPAYELVLEPRDTRSLVGSVRVAVDSRTHVPLRVQVYAAGSTGRPAFETAFSSVRFGTPPAHVFAFTPPPGSTVSTTKAPGHAGTGTTDRPGAGEQPGQRARAIGSGWTTVVELPSVDLAAPAPTDTTSTTSSTSAPSVLGALTRAMTPVPGGRVLRTALLSVLVTDDGRAYVGAVRPSVLQQAAGL